MMNEQLYNSCVSLRVYVLPKRKKPDLLPYLYLWNAFRLLCYKISNETNWESIHFHNTYIFELRFSKRFFKDNLYIWKLHIKKWFHIFATSFLWTFWIHSAKWFANLQLYCTLFPTYLKITVLPGTAVENWTNKIREDNTANKISFLQLRSQ